MDVYNGCTGSCLHMEAAGISGGQSGLFLGARWHQQQQWGNSRGKHALREATSLLGDVLHKENVTMLNDMKNSHFYFHVLICLENSREID